MTHGRIGGGAPTGADDDGAGGAPAALVLLGVLAGGLCLGAAFLFDLGSWAVALAFPAGGGAALVLAAIFVSRRD